MVRIWPQSLQDILNILQNADRKARQRYLRIEATSGPARLDLAHRSEGCQVWLAGFSPTEDPSVITSTCARRPKERKTASSPTVEFRRGNSTGRSVRLKLRPADASITSCFYSANS